MGYYMTLCLCKPVFQYEEALQENTLLLKEILEELKKINSEISYIGNNYPPQ